MNTTQRSAPASKRPYKSVSRNCIDREAWIAAALEGVARGGFSEVRVLALAKTLGVSRGSFYWHFSDQEALIDAVIDRWRDLQIQFSDSIRPEPGEAPAAYFERVVREHIATAKVDFASFQIEMAIRILSNENMHARAVSAEIDAMRVKNARDTLRPLVKDKELLAEMALLLYANIAGAKLIYAHAQGSAISPDRLAASVAKTLLARAAA